MAVQLTEERRLLLLKHAVSNLLRIIPVAIILLFGATNLAHAQSGASGWFALGTATDSSTTIDSEGDVGPSMGGVFVGFGGDLMIRPSIGFGAEYSFHATRPTYVTGSGVTYRPAFYDFNAMWHPIASESRVIPEFQGGIGGANLRFYETETGCAIGNTVCQTLNEYISSSNHFQLHGAVALRLYITSNIYIRPQVDLHWVNNFQEFGRDAVPEYSVAIGFSSGR
jgi:hypothetical protein